MSVKINKDNINKKTNISFSISGLVLELTKANSNIEHNPKDPFSAKKIPGIPIDYYIERIKKYSGIEESTLVLTLIHCDRICGLTDTILNPHNIHRLFMSCCLLAIKYNEDCFYSNEYYARVGGVDLKEINDLERCCIQLLNFDLYVNDEIYEKYVNYLGNY